MRQNRRTPRTRTQNNPVRFFNSGERLRAGASILRGQTNIVNPLLLREVHLTDHLHTLNTTTVMLTQHGAVNDHRIQRHRQHTAARIQQGTRPVQTRNRVIQQLPESRNQQVTESMVIQRELTLIPLGRAKTMLHHITPRATPIGVITQRRKRHTQISRRENTHLLTQTTRRAAIVSNRHNSRQIRRDVAKRRQGTVQPVAAAHRRDLRRTVRGLQQAQSLSRQSRQARNTLSVITGRMGGHSNTSHTRKEWYAGPTVCGAGRRLMKHDAVVGTRRAELTRGPCHGAEHSRSAHRKQRDDEPVLPSQPRNGAYHRCSQLRWWRSTCPHGGSPQARGEEPQGSC